MQYFDIEIRLAVFKLKLIIYGERNTVRHQSKSWHL